MARLPHCLFLDQRDAASDARSLLVSGGRSVRFHPVSGRRERRIERPWRSGLRSFAATAVPGLPPFQGGAAGLFGYELGRSLENVPSAQCDEFQVPALAVGFYDVVVAFDHLERRAWLISQGWPETEPGRRRHRAERRLAQARRWLGLDGRNNVDESEASTTRTDRQDDPRRRLMAPHIPDRRPGRRYQQFLGARLS